MEEEYWMLMYVDYFDRIYDIPKKVRALKVLSCKMTYFISTDLKLLLYSFEI